MKDPVCEMDTCYGRPATYYHTIRGLMLCPVCAGTSDMAKEAAALMEITVNKTAPGCRFNNCKRPAKYSSRNGDRFCATHSTGLPFDLLTEIDPQVKHTLVQVRIPFGSESGFDLIPLVETVNSLGRAGYKVSNLSWPFDDQKTLALHIEETAFKPSSDLRRQIQTVEKQYDRVKTDLAGMTRRVAEKSVRIEELSLNIKNIVEAREQDHLRFISLLGDARIETVSLPLLDTEEGDRSA